MTEQEAVALATRLARVWGVSSYELDWEPANEFDHEHFDFVASTEETTLVYHYYVLAEEVVVYLESGSAYVELDYREGRTYPSFNCSPGDLYEEWSELLRQFVVQWMPYFRRGCWLSGCPIEASAHEKAEWIQGFSREELEAWNLKI